MVTAADVVNFGEGIDYCNDTGCESNSASAASNTWPRQIARNKCQSFFYPHIGSFTGSRNRKNLMTSSEPGCAQVERSSVYRW